MYFFTMMIKKLPDETKGSPSHHKIPLNLLLPNPLQLKQPFLSLSNLLHLFFIPLHLFPIEVTLLVLHPLLHFLCEISSFSPKTFSSRSNPLYPLYLSFNQTQQSNTINN